MGWLALGGKICKLLCCGFSPGHRSGELHAMQFPTNPRQLEKLGPKWLTAALHSHGSLEIANRVVSFELQDLGAKGMLGELRQIAIVYESPTLAPTVAVVKFASNVLSSRLITDLFDFNRAEFYFYTRLRNTMEDVILAPKCLFADFNQRTNQFCLILEHLKHTRDATFCNQLDGVDIPLEDARLIMQKLAKVHARFWGSRSRDPAFEGWLNRMDNASMLSVVVPQERLLIKGVKTRTCGGTKPSDWTYVFPEDVSSRWGLFTKATTIYLSRLENHPLRTVTHGDPRLDNWFFYKDGSSGERSAGLVDWQLQGLGVAPTDLSWFLATSMSPAFCEEHEADLIEHYLMTLRAHLPESTVVDSKVFWEE